MHIPLERYFDRHTSSNQWCEPNNVYTEYIAEFWNTVSGGALLVYPVIMLLISHRYTRFFTSKSHGTWLIHCAIGLASIYYHATLSLAGQLVDETAILWVLVYTLAIWLPKTYYEKYLTQSKFQVCCSVVGVLITFMGMISPILNAFCLLGLGIPFSYIVLTEVLRFNLPATNALCKRVGFFVLCGVTVWALDRAYCPTWRAIGFPYFHSVWHCCIAVAGHEVCVIAMYFHSLEQWKDLHTEVAYWPKSFPRHLTFPYVHMVPKDERNNNYKHQSSYVVQNGVSNGKSKASRRF